MILNPRGTNGSGKSTLVRDVMAKFPPMQAIYGMLGPRKPEAYKLRIDWIFKPKPKAPRFLYILGPYLTPAGGADCIQPYDCIPKLIEQYALQGDVMFEGVLVGKTKGSVGECLEQWGKQSVLLFLDTSMEECIASVQGRRTERGDVRPFNTKNLVDAYKAVFRVRKRLMEEDKVRVVDVSRENGLETILELLREANR